jgi:small-conductance mechanosensitive channel
MKPDFNLFMDVQQAINVQLVRSFAEQHIQFAFPTQTLNVNQIGQVEPGPASKGLVPPH